MLRVKRGNVSSHNLHSPITGHNYKISSTWVDEATVCTIEWHNGQSHQSWSSWRSLYLRTLDLATRACIEIRLIITADMCWGPWWRHNDSQGSKCEVFLEQLPTRIVSVGEFLFSLVFNLTKQICSYWQSLKGVLWQLKPFTKTLSCTTLREGM